MYNYGSSSIELNGFYLTDNINRPDKYNLPQEIIQGGEHTFYWLDKDLNQGVNHAPFKLSSEGEELALFEKEGKYWHLRDYVSFGSIENDVSYGRVFDGSHEWQFFQNPTPNSTNNILKIPLPKTNNLVVQPNPSNSGIFKLNEYRNVCIFDVMGREIKTYINTNEIDINNYPKGVYFMITSLKERQKLIKN